MTKQPKIGRFIDEEEREMFEALEAENTVFVIHLTPQRKLEIEQAARAAMNPTREKITLRIARNDLVRLKSRALREGMPYQTLINSILHKAVS